MVKKRGPSSAQGLYNPSLNLQYIYDEDYLDELLGDTEPFVTLKPTEWA